jgi:hypothetical protein
VAHAAHPPRLVRAGTQHIARVLLAEKKSQTSACQPFTSSIKKIPVVRVQFAAGKGAAMVMAAEAVGVGAAVGVGEDTADAVAVLVGPVRVC